MNIKTVAEKYALENAVRFNGRASSGNVLGKVLAVYPDWKSKIKEVKDGVEGAVAAVNAMKPEKQRELLLKIAPELLEEKKAGKKELLKPLPNIKKNVVMRFEPSPSGPLHIGHAYPLLLNSEYCKRYGGRLIIRIADTNPDNIDPAAYKLIKEDAEWATEHNISGIEIQSDRMESYYKHALELISKGHAYVCTCPGEEFRSLSIKMMPCSCRGKSEKQNIADWHKMFGEYEEGAAVVRLKTDLRHKNPALRDFAIARINLNEHPRQKSKYRVWPLMNFSVAVDDHDMAVTHVIRGKDHYDNTKRQLYIYNYFKWTPPEFFHSGKINFEGLKLSCSKTRKAINEHQYEGWDDIRLPFLQALKRRGYQPKALAKFFLSIGLTLVDKRVEAGEFFKGLNFYNKEIIDPIAKRFFFIPSPKKVKIAGAPKQDIELDLHPDNIKGGRRFAVGADFLISEKDYKDLKSGKMYRLMDCLNFRKAPRKLVFDSLEYMQWKGRGEKIIHWLPADEKAVKVVLCMPDGTRMEGVGESSMKDLGIGDIVQLERVAFARLDAIEDDTLIFWFTQ